jgi:hypothetical protein
MALVLMMVTVSYPRRHVKTRRHLSILGVGSCAMVQPFLLWRLTTERAVIGLALGGLALVAALITYRGLRYLTEQEREHQQPTPDMMFVFTLLAGCPLAINVFLLILLAEM